MQALQLPAITSASSATAASSTDTGSSDVAQWLALAARRSGLLLQSYYCLHAV
jgi:hypothetical protein